MVKKRITVERKKKHTFVNVRLPNEFILLVDQVCKSGNENNPELEPQTTEDVIVTGISDLIDGICEEIAQMTIDYLDYFEENSTVH